MEYVELEGEGVSCVHNGFEYQRGPCITFASPFLEGPYYSHIVRFYQHFLTDNFVCKVIEGKEGG